MGDTWNFDELFPGVKKKHLINELFFRLAIASANHSEVLLSHEGKVQGYLFGRLPVKDRHPLRRMWRSLSSHAWALWQFISGKIGPRMNALKRIRELIEMDQSLEELRQSSDAYVNLFFVSSSLRGTGRGRQLMSNFEMKALRAGCPRIYLWTDKGCNYGFYDNSGFSRIREIASPLLAHYDGGPNGFVYAKETDAGFSA
jgi:GNAT superfamily N-acetyltransferase